jgi:hypothetical protein
MSNTVEEFGLNRGLVPSYGEAPLHPLLSQDNLQLPMNIFPITGAFLDKTAYQPYANALREYGQNVEIVELDYAKPDKTLDDYAEELIGVMGDMDNIVLNPHSRPYDVALRALAILKDRGEAYRIRALIAMDTGGSHLVTPKDPVIAALPRHTDEFKSGVGNDPEDERREILDPDIARSILGRFIADKDFLESIVAGMHPQPKPRTDLDSWREFPREVSVTVIQGKLDPALNLSRAKVVLEQTHGRAPREIADAGHMLPAEMPDVAASLLIKHAVIAQIR